MGFFNSLFDTNHSGRPGGVLYALLAYALILSLNLSSPLPILAAFLVYLFYLGSRLLLLFFLKSTPLTIDGKEKDLQDHPPRRIHSKRQPNGWEKFYHQHDIVLFRFLGILSLTFLVSLIMDGLGGNPFGETIQNLWNTLLTIF